ncbi:hypothetical protein ACHAXT_010503 [Thalassiosira profunda]
MAFAHPSTRGPPSTETLARRRWPARIAGESGRLFAARGSNGENADGSGVAVEKGADGRTANRRGGQIRKKGKSAAKKGKKGKKSSTTAQSDDATTPSSSSSHDDMYIQFSRAFQRHVVYRGKPSGDNTSSSGTFASDDEVVQSFEFLDDAARSFPEARILAPCDLPFPPPSCSLVYPDDDDGVAGSGGRDRRNSQQLTVSRGRLIDADVEEEECETTIAGMGLWTVCEFEYPSQGVGASANPELQHEEANAALRTLLQLVSSESFVVPRHFFRLDPRRLAMRGHTPASITMNHFRMVNLLSCGGGDGTAAGLAMDPSDVAFVLQNFPQLCLYDGGELEGLITFLLQPLPPDGTIPSVAMVADGRGLGSTTVDWPCLAGKGYGAGLTVEQATDAIRMMPELLALYYEDSRKPSVMYLYNQMNAAPASPKLIDEANARLNLEGTDGSDAYTFAHLRSIGISWGQLRILASALPLWTTCNLEPGWELLQKGPVRSMLKRPALDYLRQRLQIGPGDVYRLLKTHGRLSTYDACKKILPTLDMIQGRLGLSSAELRRLVLRMPSVMGVGQSSFAERVAFFTEEAGLSVDDVRKAALKQPSLLQYSVEATLRPKLRFFIDELGMSQTSVARVLQLAPAVMGLSLTDNLRPKLVSMMQFCALDVREIGQIVSTSPQTLLLSQKGKIEPVLKFLSRSLMLKEPRELGKIVLTTPRVMVQGMESLSKKLELLTASNIQKSRDVGVAIARKNPALLALSNSVLEDRIDRCPAGIDIATWLQPTKKGRKRLAEQLAAQPKGDPVIASLDANDLHSSVTKIYPNEALAAKDFSVAESAILGACQNGTPVDGTYLHSLADLPLTTRIRQETEEAAAEKRKVIPVRMFCSGAVYPRDSADAARGQRKTGGLAVQVFTDGSSHDKAQFLKDFSAAAETCFGIRVPIGEGQDGSELVAIFPLMNPSRNRCELFACSGALRICEELLKGKHENEDGVLYDIRVYTDSSYAWKYVKSKQRLLDLGSCATSQEMLEHLHNVAGHTANIDILHPLARSFSRMSGQTEPADSTQQTLNNAYVEFVHSMDGIGANDDRLRYVKRLQLHARSAAMWQFNRERNNLVA